MKRGNMRSYGEDYDPKPCPTCRKMLDFAVVIQIKEVKWCGKKSFGQRKGTTTLA